MSDKPVLKLDWCSHAAAKYAVEHWHYESRCLLSRGKDWVMGTTALYRLCAL